VTGHGYPHDLAGDPAPPPEPVGGRVLDMAVRAHERLRAAAGPPLETAAPWRTARAIDALFASANRVAPGRSTRSDGRKGDAAHEKLGRGSDHNPWLIHGGRGIVRAGDLTNDPVLRLPEVFEELRRGARAGSAPQLVGGGYLILNRRITAEDFSGWREYTGSNPHVSHGHVSVSLNPAQFDLDSLWGAFDLAAAGQPAPAPAPGPAPAPAPAGFTGPDLRGAGPGLRGEQGNNGPRVAAWQAWLAEFYPAYRHTCGHLEVDGWWGPVTSRWNREFGHRSGVRSADGLNIGPQLAAAYHRAGLFRQLSAARARVLGHVYRAERR
jgi:hypothetical protein